MIKGRDIICHALPTWEGDYMKAVVQLMTQFAKYNRVLYVDYSRTYKDVFLGNSRQQVSHKTLELKLSSEQGKLYVLKTPSVFPTNWISSEAIYSTLQSIEANKVARAINKAQRNLNFENPILINAFNPQFGLPIMGKLGEAVSIYYCYDEINAAEWCKVHGGDAEKRYMAEVDAVVVTSRGLKKNKSKYTTNCHLVQNGVDFELFSNSTSTQKAHRPVIGYVGTVDDRIDYELLEKLALANPNKELRLIGRMKSEKAEELAEKLNNVTLTGSKQPKELAPEMKGIDIGIIPFVKNEFTKNIYPLKVNEYLAAEKPVVSTHFSDLASFGDVIAIAENHQSFINSVGSSLETDNATKREVRLQFAKTNSWQNRAVEFSRIISLTERSKKQWR